MKKFIIFSMVAIGCGGIDNNCPMPQADFTIINGEDAAYKIVWNNTYNVTQYPHPWVGWVYQPNLICDVASETSTNAGQALGISWCGQCVGGLFDGYFAAVAKPNGYDISSTAFAHELFHAYLYDTTGDLDPSHTDSRWWQSNGPVQQAEGSLMKAGL